MDGSTNVRTIGFRRAELALALGTLFPPDQALEVGLVDEVVNEDGLVWSSNNPVTQKAYDQAKIFAKIPPQARVASKIVTRDEHIRDIIAKREEDTEHFCGFVTHEAVQCNLKTYVEALKKKSKKK